MTYASVASLTRTIDLLLISNSPVQSLVCGHEEGFLALREKVSSLEVCLKNFEEMTDLEAQIREVACLVEHTIQLRLHEVVMANNEMQKEQAHQRLCDSLKQVTKEIDRVQNESRKIQYKDKQASEESLIQTSNSEKHTLNVENNMVGCGDQMKWILAELKRYGGSSSELKLIPIIGMGGIGKTTLANEVYNDSSIRSHFDVRAWATISQQHNVKSILLSLLRSTTGKTFDKEDEADLADMLQKSLKGRRYLIVLDDMWSTKAWDDVRLCFPSENKGSRILLTTRNGEVACLAGTENLALQMDLMNIDESWELFKSIAFANEVLSSEFETIGKQIVDKCHGLPLTIVVVAGLLKSKSSIEDWGSVAEDVTSFVTNDPDKQCSHVLGLSYNHLTSALKACLLYFATFLEDSVIPVKKLVRLWIAEGFLKSEKDLEGEGEKCLQDLINRCLVLVSKKDLDETKISSCKVHDLIYELCLREAQRQNTFVMNHIVCDDDADEDDDLSEDDDYSDVVQTQSDDTNPVPPECHLLRKHKMMPCERWTDNDVGHDFYRAILTPECNHSIRGQTDNDDYNDLKRTRSIFFCGRYFACSLKSDIIHFKLLRILNLSHEAFNIFPSQILSLIWLTYLELGGTFRIPPEIFRLWNLQTFINHGYRLQDEILPQEIWDLKQLRHLKLDRMYLPNPDKERYLNFSSIHTISGLSPSCCTEEVISGIQSVKQLRFRGSPDGDESFGSPELFDNLVHLHQLETLSFKRDLLWTVYGISSMALPSQNVFPATLKKLKLERTHLRWEDLNIIAKLPNLEVLKLIAEACAGKEWSPIVGGFTQLKILIIYTHYFKYWKASDDNFPVLERLVIRNCRYLEEIPIEFAEINSLQLIELEGCTPELEACAASIKQEQEDIGNNPVDVRIIYTDQGTTYATDQRGHASQYATVGL